MITIIAPTLPPPTRRNHSLRVLPLICLSLLASILGGEAQTSRPRIVSIAAEDGEIHLSWEEGRATYQVQTSETPAGPWHNVGTAGESRSARLPLQNRSAFFRVLADATARYEVVFDSTWSQRTHPTNWPSNAHWSGLVGGTHNDSVHFWREGEPASEGIRLMAERGQQATLLSEIAPAISRGDAELQLAGGGIALSPGSVTLRFPKPMNRAYPLVTLVSMIAPSPDWFAGVDSLSLLQDGEWVKTHTAVLYGMDAGTDSGATFTSPDEVTSPRQRVQRFTGFPAILNGEIVPFGTFTFRRLD